MMTDNRDWGNLLAGICLLEEEGTRDLCVSQLKPDHFRLDSDRRIFTKIIELHNRREPVNAITVGAELDKDKQLSLVGGMAYLCGLTEGLPRRITDAAVLDYIGRAKEDLRLRQLAGLSEWITARGGDSTSAEVVSDAARQLEEIVSDAADEDAGIETSIVRTLDNFCEQRNLKVSPGLSYGLPLLDAQTGGMMPGYQTAVGAASGVGKTTFMCQSIWASLSSGAPVEAFLLEPTKDQVTLRLLSLMTGVRYSSVIRPWTSTPSEAETIMRAASRLSEMPLRLHDRATMSLEDVVSQARVGINRHGTRLVCLDYIQRLKIKAAERDEPIRQRVARASMAMADLVKGTQCHSLLLSQINTGRKNGAQALPTMFDFRESSQIENDAHTILLLHRHFDAEQGHYTDEGACIVPKQRFGSPCNIKLFFDNRMAAWKDSNF